VAVGGFASEETLNGVVFSKSACGFGSDVLSKFLSAFTADASMMSEFGFAAATAAIARGFVKGITFGGGVEPCAVRRPETEGMRPSCRATRAEAPTSTSVRSSIPKSLTNRVTFGIERSAVP
jgi:hypothetical protein